MTDLIGLVDSGGRYGESLRQALVDKVSRQLQLAFMVEVPASPSNRITVSPDFTDQLGNMRPVLTYDIPEYTMRGVAYARQLSKRIFARLGAEDHTVYNPNFWGYAVHDGEGYELRGGNHLAGTHVMGRDPSTSVVDADQRCWDYENLYMVGGGSMPTVGTSNVTLTVAALCLRSARAMLAQLDSETAPIDVSADRHHAASLSAEVSR
jgi:choline dehydrogenase-like flavoprotein